jgi:Putative prokaryotic signal transducing protein
MKCVYEAADVLEAHVIQGLLEQHRISAFIEGEYLLGAVGELPASRLVRVLVNDDDLTAGSTLMRDYDSTNHPLSTQTPMAEGGMPRRASWLLWAMAIMIIMEVTRYF